MAETYVVGVKGTKHRIVRLQRYAAKNNLCAGEAYLAARQGAEAAVEFQKILDHRGAVVSDPIHTLAHLQLARAYVISGDTRKAKGAYQDFLTLWKDADSDIPIFQRAKAEYARLN